jgi:hypothetical protein
VRGIVNEDFVDLSTESGANLEAIPATPSSALGSTRDKPDLAYCRNILAALKAHGASWFLYIGGNDTAETVRIVSEEGSEGKLRPALDPSSQDHRQRSDGKRPRAGLSHSGAVRRPGVHEGRPR